MHGAKIVGLLERALDERPAAVLLLVESGGVRLHEANAG
ncbi:acetyl-CoA carboxylase beta subunit, partial [Rhodoblastus acidophilus]|nr:acetyl-CoA carboxylase beta subunit [Rhodoblastus acidophilus]MCW2335081.1 acetyl-CoA carboxylase beta subunit [Rhodoblastus acidophilus]